jgi:hypothetical protein
MIKVHHMLIFLLPVIPGCSDYSSGERSGVITKFSRKGFMFKTYEGEINLGGLKTKKDGNGNSTVVANTFEFSLDAKQRRGENLEALKDSVEKAMNLGLPVKLHYNQEKMTNWGCARGSTDYFVDKVQILY